MHSGCHALLAPATRCQHAAEPFADPPFCSRHLIAAYDWVSREFGVTDLLPSPCLACGSRLGVRYPSGWLCAVCEWRVGEIPESSETPPRVDVVYYLRFRDRVKIGTSANPRLRLTQLKHDELLAFERGDRITEHRRHAQFAADRFGSTEWFLLSDSLAGHIAGLATDDPWSTYALWLSQHRALGH